MFEFTGSRIRLALPRESQHAPPATDGKELRSAETEPVNTNSPVTNPAKKRQCVSASSFAQSEVREQISSLISNNEQLTQIRASIAREQANLDSRRTELQALDARHERTWQSSQT